AFILRNRDLHDYKTIYVRLVDNNSQEKENIFLSGGNRFITQKSNFFKIPSSPIAYWAGKNIINAFSKGDFIGEKYDVKSGISTGDNDAFVKMWYEVDYSRMALSKDINYKWYPYNKGGGYRKWYGNNLLVVNWENDGFIIKNSKKAVIRNPQYYFREGITWSGIGTGLISFRYSKEGTLFDSNKGPMIFFNNGDLKYVLGYMNTKIVNYIANLLNPTLSLQIGDVSAIPIIINEKYYSQIYKYVDDNITISKIDWNSFEISRDFKVHPFLNKEINPMYLNIETGLPSKTIESAYKIWKYFAETQFTWLKANEEELNRIFIEIYGLQDELTPEVEEKDITIRKADRERDIKSFISYAVGCMLGRYSIDADDLIYAGGDFKDKWKYEDGQWKVRKIVKDEEGKVVEDTWVDATFAPDTDNVLPITDDEYFEDDIVNRFIEFLKVTFGEDTLEENLDYIADTLGKKASETARQAIRRYFLKDFYKDHVKVYQKRPIYWLFDSGKQDGFKALIYMHRYDEFTVARVRTDYLHKLQKSYEAEIKRLDIVIGSNVSQREKTNARKKKEQILKQMEECLQYDQVIAHVANQRIQIDLDDGVKVNYDKFQGVEIPQGEGRKPLKADLLAKI
ncbi:MAG: BREX-1 system adenine-specific DNA-methyltransferase PglX, partial [Clostridiales bacterium]|nr:BREX-1 system adenine-specific DNA-methyltransferase PglX [Clostridiales bacterium]